MPFTALACPPENSVGWLSNIGPYSGTFVAIEQRGQCTIAITAWHVVEYADKQWLDQAIIRADVKNDIVLLRLCGGEPPPCLMSISPESPRLGDALRIIGWPKGITRIVYPAVMSGLVTIKGRTYMVFGSHMASGMSGGAVVDRYGRLVGIVVAGYEPDTPIGFAVPFAVLIKLVEGQL